ncbi:two-component sensor histidine kinase [Geomicrobium sp. JCM 19037]|uniref:sensor histidine kinase n=1 Tax=Geomicrobium sp. JCM 19037 TaxID=1460634 RepID=UPI00045F1771|nr:HAMP domain-containing sensor histidine kinase [Geomicrobium sp. JCM 19037]GAK06146.1 two-component sensor histidine kinase [Geomicrobium sp. JCM 19037]
MTYSHFHMKEPVFVNDEIVGFFEVSIPRTERLAYVQSRSTLVFGASVVVVLFMSALIWFVLNRRINKPIQALRVDMDRFAKHVDSSESILYKKRDEIGELIQHFEQMKQETYEARKRVQQEQKEKETMTAALSHDLRTPLTSVLAYTESLQERELEPKTKEKYLATIRKKSLHMQQLIEDLHTFNLLKSDTVKERKVTIDGDEFFEMLTDGYDELCASKQITLNKQVNMSGSYDVHVNHMMRLVDNLVSNAIRHTPIGGEIHLLFQDAGQLPEWLFTQVDIDFQHFGVLIVQNEGETIDMVEANRIFEPFYQSDSSRTKEQGQHSGLGSVSQV